MIRYRKIVQSVQRSGSQVRWSRNGQLPVQSHATSRKLSAIWFSWWQSSLWFYYNDHCICTSVSFWFDQAEKVISQKSCDWQLSRDCLRSNEQLHYIVTKNSLFSWKLSPLFITKDHSTAWKTLSQNFQTSRYLFIWSTATRPYWEKNLAITAVKAVEGSQIL